MDAKTQYAVVSALGLMEGIAAGAFQSGDVMITDTEILAWAYGSLFLLNSSTRDANGAIVAASITWPDGTAGVFTTDVASVAFPGAIDAWHATYGDKTITQPTVTRDLNGAVTSQPAIEVTE